MPGLQGDTIVAAMGSPIKKNKLSLKFFQKKETKRALDFSEPQPDEPKTAEPVEQEPSSCDQVVHGPSPCPPSPSPLLSAEKKETLVPFIGFNNLGNTCYLNSVLQVLYYCPGLREGIKKLYSLSKKKEKPKEESEKTEETEEEPVAAHMDLLCSFNSLISSVEQLQSSFLLNPEAFTESDLATPPRKILNTLRQLNSMYEGYLQHDAQEVLQCILGYLHEASDTIRKEQGLEKEKNIVPDVTPENSCATNPKTEEEGQVNGKRKSDTEAGNAKKKPKSVKSKTSDGEEEASVNKVQTRSKRKSSSDVPIESAQVKDEEKEAANIDGTNQEEESGDVKKVTKETNKGKKRAKLGSWLRSSKKQQNDKQPSIFSKFRSVGKISSSTAKNQVKAETEEDKPSVDIQEKSSEEPTSETKAEETTAKTDDVLELMERLFQGQLVLRTRCLECESFTERREDFQDISVPVLDEEPPSPEDLSEVSPDPKPELKTLNWAIGQFASVEHIFGEDKYFCETCRHYTEAERSLLFDKTPEVITIHLKRFSANSLELDLYGGLCKVNTPLQTPLTLCLDEWCTRRSAKGQKYELFAVVMHSGVTISSGHYTAYVRMSDLKHVQLWSSEVDKEKTEEDEKDIKTETKVKDEQLDYDDGEVSFNVSSRGQRGTTSAKTGGKKISEGGVGLLGGQRSLSACELGNKQTEKSASSGPSEGSKRRKTVGSVAQNSDAGVKKEHEDGTEGQQANSKASETKALDSLLEYEGKWMLFDDSEVHMFDEEDFLRACSPETSSSSTPYLLFYRRTS